MIVLMRFGRQRVDDETGDGKHALVLDAIDNWQRSRRCQRHPNDTVFIHDINSPDREPLLIDLYGFGLGFQLTTRSFSTSIDDRESPATLTPMIIDMIVMLPRAEALSRVSI